jgi:hypothetical protein
VTKISESGNGWVVVLLVFAALLLISSSLPPTSKCAIATLNASGEAQTPRRKEVVNPESHCRTSKVATISHGPSVRHSHARWASGEGTDS